MTIRHQYLLKSQPQDPCLEIRLETSDEEGSVARSGNTKSQRLKDQMAKMAKEYEELKKGKHQGIWKNPLGNMNALFSKRIREAGFPPKFWKPSKRYSRTEDPISHLESFVHRMEVQNATRSAICKMFPSTLIDTAKTWFRKLPPGSVDSFSKLTTAFCAQFQGIKPRPKNPILLQYVTQERGETLRSYMEKFHKEVILMGVFDEKETLANFRRNLWPGRLFRSFAKHPPETY
ncbi:hypothetical protein QYF36_024221 [Acer negundo]|nr:hypothetical protein QYF36_024221 [Acer negundo]